MTTQTTSMTPDMRQNVRAGGSYQDRKRLVLLSYRSRDLVSRSALAIPSCSELAPINRDVSISVKSTLRLDSILPNVDNAFRHLPAYCG